MTNYEKIADDIKKVGDSVAPDSALLKAIETVLFSAIDPSPANLLSDISLIIQIVKQLKSVLKDKHPSLTELVKSIL